MQKLLLFVDKISTWVGQAFSWIIVLLTLHVTWEVFSRYVLDHPRAWAFDARSNFTSEGPPVDPFKTVIPLAGAFILVQGIVEIIRCVICLKQGYWPSREADVQEVDVDKLKEELNVKDEDIQKLDQYVVAKEPRK